MGPDTNYPQPQPKPKAARWVGTIIVIILLIIVILLLLRPWERFDQVQPTDEEGREGPAQIGLTLDGSTLHLAGATPSDVDLSPLIKEVANETFDKRADELSDEDEQEEVVTQDGDTTIVESGDTINNITNVSNNYTTQNFTTINEDQAQTLALNGNILSISDGNNVALPTSDDNVVGNEVTDVAANAGLVRIGSGTALDPYQVGLQICPSGELLKSTGPGTWECANDGGGTAYTAGDGLQLTVAEFSIDSPTCAGTDKLQWNGTAFACTADENTTYTAGTGLNLVGTTFNNDGVLTVAGDGPISSSGGQNPTIDFVDGTAAGQVWQWNGTDWVLATSMDGDSVIGNEVVGGTGANSGLTRSGAGTDVDPYTLAVNTGNGLQVMSNAVLIDSPTCAGTDKLQWSGTAFTCTADENTTYTAGIGLDLTGTTFSNTGVLTVGVSGPLTSSGGQNPNVTFADGTTAGEFWQWDGTNWVLATSSDGDMIIGNEIVNVTGANSGLTRSGSGTSGDPYTVAANVGNGMAITGNAISIDSPTCAGTEKLQWDGTDFNCAADQDTTYTAGTGLDLTGTTFSNTGILSITGSSAVNVSAGQSPTVAFADGTTAGQFWQWNGTDWALATDTDGDMVIGNEITNVGANSGLTRSGSGTSGDPYTVAANTGDGLQIASNAITIDSATCAGTDKLQWNGTAFVCSADQDTTYTAGAGLSLVGTTFSNTGVLTVTGSGPLVSSGGQNPDITFADGTTAGQFWQWDGANWTLATDTDGDTVVGNEVTNVTGTNSGLVRSGTGTNADPYTLATNTGDGLQIASNVITVDSPTCAGTDKLQWNGTAFACATDQNTTYTAGTGLTMVGTAFNLADTAVTGGTFGSQTATEIPTFTVDAQGRLTAAGSYALTGSGPISVSSGTISCSTCLTTTSLQSAYDGGNTITTTDGRNITFNLADTATDADFVVNLQGTGNEFTVQDSGTNVLSVGDTGTTLFQNTTDQGLYDGGTNAFAVQNAAGGNMLSIDTANGLVTIGEVQSGQGLQATAQLAIGDTCSGAAQGCILIGEYGTSDSDRLQLHGATGLMFTTEYTQEERMFLSTSGQLGINTITPTNTLDVNGTVRVRNFGGATATTVCRDANGVLSACSSSQKYKENIEDLGYGMDIVSALRPVSFDWKDRDEHDIGFIAEEVAQHVPEVVTYKDGEVEGINYHMLTAVLTNAIQEQQVQIEELQKSTWNGGLVARDSTFNGYVSFNGDVKFNGNIDLPDNTAGEATIPAGQTSAQVTFSQPHTKQPVVNATPQDFQQGSYRVTNITKQGFTIELAESQSVPVRFSWNALMR